VPGGGWPGSINPAVVPNFLFIADGFPPADSGTFEQLVASMVHRFKTTHLTTPFDVLATSMNFWQTFMPSDVRGISVRCEVYVVEQDGKRRGYMVPNPEQPPAAGKWTKLEHLVYAVGLPVSTDLPSNTNRTNDDIQAEWTVLYRPDLAPHLSDELITAWRRLGNRCLLEEKDTTLGMAYGNPPRVDGESDDLFVDFHPYRLDRQRLDRFLATLRGDQGHDLTTLWAAPANGPRPTNYDYVFIFSSCKWDRGHNKDGYIAMNVDEQNFLLGISTSGNGACQWDPPSILSSVSSLRSGRALHEVAHSFGLGDEYANIDRVFTGSAADLERYGNLQAATDAQTGGQLDGEAIKWNWLRARKGALVRDTVTSSGSNRWRVQLQPGRGLQFAVGDKVVLRKRNYPKPLGKNPAETVVKAADGQITVLEIAEPRSADEVTVVGAINPDLTFGEGDVLYMPTPAPESVRSATYPFAGLVAKNIKDFITATHKPLTPDPCVPAEAKKDVQDPILDGVDLPICFSEKPRIVGLYHGGRQVTCGIFHPAGTCMMHSEPYDEREFCAVCRYILVEIIDPFKHFEIDLQYDNFYPQR
jgi:hypothetical protein